MALSTGLGLIPCPADCLLLWPGALECPSFPFDQIGEQHTIASHSTRAVMGPLGLLAWVSFRGPVEAMMGCTKTRPSATAVTDSTVHPGKEFRMQDS